MSELFGVDVGNYSTKTRDLSFISGFSVSSTKIVDDNDLEASTNAKKDFTMEFEGQFYNINSIPFPYNEDKTVNNRCVIFTLFAIAKQKLYNLQSENINHPNLRQNEINKMNSVSLSIGLPPLLKPTYEKKTIECYRNFFNARPNGAVRFNYGGYTFEFTLDEIFVFPQGAPVVTLSLKEEHPIFRKEYGDYIIVDIGGGTTDIIVYKDNSMNVDSNRCSTTTNGSNGLLESIRNKILQAERIDYKDNENVIEKYIKQMSLLKKRENNVAVSDEEIKSLRTVINASESQKAIIEETCKEWVLNNILGELRLKKIDPKITPIVFMGGTSLMLEPIIDEVFAENGYNKNLHTYINTSCANAMAFEKVAKARLKKMGKL